MPSRGAIRSIDNALTALGEDNIRRWATLATLPKLATNKPGELVKLALVRARFCERLAEQSHNENSNEAFLVGMFSLLGALIDQPLEEALRGVDLGRDITEALLGNGPAEDFLTRVYRLTRCYEAGDWEAVERFSQRCGTSTAAIGEAYLDATAWAQRLVNTLGA